jgi:hypothetical protein
VACKQLTTVFFYVNRFKQWCLAPALKMSLYLLKTHPPLILWLD